LSRGHLALHPPAIHKRKQQAQATSASKNKSNREDAKVGKLATVQLDRVAESSLRIHTDMKIELPPKVLHHFGETTQH